MSKIVIFSDLFLTTFPFLELKLFNRCREMGIETLFVLQKNDYRLIDPELFKVFSKIATVVQNPKKDLLTVLNKEDLGIMRFGYKGLVGDVATTIRNNGRKLLMLDPAAVDIFFRECPAQFLAVKSQWIKEKVVKNFGKKYGNIFVTGTIHFDDVVSTECDKKQFMESYNLDSNKKLAILTPANPAEQGHQKGVNNEYMQIVEVVKNKCPGYEIMIKGHPMDYNCSLPLVPGIIHKNEHYNNKHSWEIFAPGSKVIKAEEGYKAFKVADVVLNVRSSIAMETPMFPIPLININRNKYVTNWPDSKNPGVMKDINICNLAKVLNENDYYIDNKSCLEYCLRYSVPKMDGKAYERIANIAKSLI